MNRFLTMAILAVILLCFGVQAFHDLTHQGLLYHDSGLYLLEAKFVDEGLHSLLSSRQETYSQSNFWQDIKTKTSGVPLKVAKPGYTMILWIVAAVLGFKDFVLPSVTVVSSLFALLLTFLIARKIGNRISAIYATVFLASSVFYLVHARSGFADPLTTVFFLAGILFFLHGKDSRPGIKNYLTGFCIGYALCVNQWRVVYMIALIFWLEFLAAQSNRLGLRHLFVCIFFESLGILSPVVAFQIPYFVASWITGPLPDTIPSYWNQLSQQWTTRGVLTWFTDTGETARMFSTVEGPLFTSLVTISWVFLLIRLALKRSFRDVVLISCSLLPFLFFSSVKAGGEAFPRMVASALPIAAICVGETLASIGSYFFKQFSKPKLLEFLVTTTVVFGLLVISLPRCARAGVTRSGYAQASRYLKSTGEKEFMILGMEPVWRFYLGRVALDPYDRPPSLKTLVKKAQKENVRYVLVDFSTLYSKYGCEYTSNLIGQLKPVATFANPRGNSLPYLADIFGFERARVVANDPSAGMIFLFSIRDIDRMESSTKYINSFGHP